MKKKPKLQIKSAAKPIPPSSSVIAPNINATPLASSLLNNNSKNVSPLLSIPILPAQLDVQQNSSTTNQVLLSYQQHEGKFVIHKQSSSNSCSKTNRQQNATKNSHHQSSSSFESHSKNGSDERCLKKQKRQKQSQIQPLLIQKRSSPQSKRDNSLAKTNGAVTSNSKYRVYMTDFELLKVLGTGAYGKVFLVRKLTGHDKGKLYAMKVLRKEVVAQKTKTLDHTRTERKVLESVRNEPFLVTMHYAFQTKTKLHLILDYVNGGELFTHLYQRDHFKEDDVKIYIGELILALEKLHKVSSIIQ